VQVPAAVSKTIAKEEVKAPVSKVESGLDIDGKINFSCTFSLKPEMLEILNPFLPTLVSGTDFYPHPFLRILATRFGVLEGLACARKNMFDTCVNIGGKLGDERFVKDTNLRLINVRPDTELSDSIYFSTKGEKHGKAY